jgi:type I restriction enzyme S subunit
LLLYLFCNKSHYENVPFEIPENWCWVTGNDIFNAMISCKPQGDEFKYIDIDSIDNKNHRIISPKILKVKNAPSRASRYTQPGDVLFSMVRPYLKNIALVEEDSCIASTGFFVCSPMQLLTSEYCYYMMLSDYVIYGLNQYMKGDNSPSINNGHITSWLYPIPPINEQLRISAEIKKWFVFIDDLERGKIELESLVKQVKSKILDLAISGKLVPQDPNDEPAIELLKRINPSFEPCDNSHYGNLPQGWAVCRLEDILDYEQPQAYIVNSTDYSDEYETPVLTAGKSFIIGYTNETNGICDRLPVIIFDDFTTDSKLVDFPFKVKSSAMKILRTKGEININYIAYYMSITRLIGDTHKRYWISEYSKLLIPIPPYQEQLRIVETVETIFNEILKITAESS